MNTTWLIIAPCNFSRCKMDYNKNNNDWELISKASNHVTQHLHSCRMLTHSGWLCSKIFHLISMYPLRPFFFSFLSVCR